MSSQPVPSARQGVQLGIPAALMRGGTSKGLYFRRADLPAGRHARDKFLLAAMGSPDSRQIDGVGGANPLTSKVAIVGPSAADDVDVDYLFAQVHTEQAIVDLSPTCGNLLAGVRPFAIERGMVEAVDGETRLRVRMVNTGGLVETVRADAGEARSLRRRRRDRRRAGNRRPRLPQPVAMRRLEDRRHAAFGTTARRD